MKKEKKEKNEKNEKRASKRWSRLEKRLGYKFKNREMMLGALSHPSSFQENEEGFGRNYEIMEFFGDSILNFIVSEMLYNKHRNLSEGKMSRVRSIIVSAKSLSDAARKISLGEHIILGKGEEKTGGGQKESILSATLEALIAAIYIDGGMANVKKVLEVLFEKKLSGLVKARKSALIEKDSKSALQEILHKKGMGLPEYFVVREEGPDHEKRFFVELKIAGESVLEGRGRSKKEAEQDAARKALMALRES
ncbi:MAG: ribonuclease III [Acidobacteriota bacterium]